VVRWTKPAKLDLKQIHNYIARDSKLYAKKVSLEIVEKSETLNSFPKSGRILYQK
jgi:toxin ParE1/3/4